MLGFKLVKNRLSIRFLKVYFKKVICGFWVTSNIKDNQKFIVDLSNHKHEHFGDQLFFVFAVIQLPSKEKFTFKIDHKWIEIYKFFNLNFTLRNLYDFDRNEYTLVTTFRSFVDIKNKKYFKKIILFDSMDKKIKKPLCEHIFYFFSGNKSIKYDGNFSSKITFPKLPKNLTNLCKKEFYVFNDVIYSRSFMKPFLVSTLINFVKNSYSSKRFIQVGGKDDLNKKNKLDVPLKENDLRGKINLTELFFLLSHPNCKGYVGFDNAIMHIALFFKKKAFVKFRGRFSKKNRQYHYRCVNCAVGEYAKSYIEYIK